MKINTQIKVYILLISFLSVCFPIQEFFHEHHFIQECISEQHGETNNEEQHCNHNVHISAKQIQEFCFFIHISKTFLDFTFDTIDLNLRSFDSILIQSIQKILLSKKFSNYLLRGPPYLNLHKN